MYCSMNKYYMKGGQKWKSITWDCELLVYGKAMVVFQYHSQTVDIIFTLQKTEAKKILGLSDETMGTLYHPRDTITYCLPTQVLLFYVV